MVRIASSGAYPPYIFLADGGYDPEDDRVALITQYRRSTFRCSRLYYGETLRPQGPTGARGNPCTLPFLSVKWPKGIIY